MSKSKVAVVTGSNKGIGFGIVKNLCSNFSGTVYLTSRDVSRGEKAVEELNKLGLKPAFHQLDINSDESVNKFAKYLKEVHGGLDVLVNNAGIAFKVNAKESITVQAEETINTNYYGTLRVCNALFPLLRPHARVVNVSSSCGHLLNIPNKYLRQEFSNSDLTVPHLSLLLYKFVEATQTKSHTTQGWPNSTYVVSKVGVSALTLIQHREFLKDSRQDIVINHVHPGYVDTDMSSHKGPLTIEQGAAAASYLALLPEGTTSPKGDYVWHDKTIVDWENGPTPGIV